MEEQALALAGPIHPLDLKKITPFEPVASSDRLRWVGLQAARYLAPPPSELFCPALTHHWLVLFARPPEELDLRYDGVKRHRPPPVGAISLLPAGISNYWRWNGTKDSLHIHLEPGLVNRVGEEAFGLDPARLTIPSLDSLELPHLRATMEAVDAELNTGSAAGPLAAESLANVMAVHLIRHVQAPLRSAQGPDGKLPRRKLRIVLEYIEEHLDAGLTLEQMAAAAQLSVYHFARQFRASTGLPPHQYVIARRVELAKEFLQAGTSLSLAEVAAHAGFSDQSQFSNHFKRLVGVTPGQFRTPARIAKQPATPAKKLSRDLLTISPEPRGAV